MGFRSSDVPDEVLIPAGTKARVRVEAAKEVATRNGGFPMLKVRLRIVEGPFSGDSIFDQNLLDHDNATAKRLGQVRVRDLSRAVGLPDWDHAGQLEGRVCDVEIGIEPARAGYAAKNVIAQYMAPGGDVPSFDGGSFGAPGEAPHPAFDPSVPF